MDRRIHNEDKQFEFEQQCWHLNPDRWAALYYERYFGDAVAAGAEQEFPVTDIDEIDRFMTTLEGKRWMTGADFTDDNNGDWV